MKLSDQISSNAHWLFRAGAVSALLQHGILKFIDLREFSELASNPTPETVLVAGAEVLGCLLLIFGGFSNSRLSDITTRAGAMLNIVVLIGIVLLVALGQWTIITGRVQALGGFEFQIILITLMAYVLLTGNKGFGQTGYGETTTS